MHLWWRHSQRHVRSRCAPGTRFPPSTRTISLSLHRLWRWLHRKLVDSVDSSACSRGTGCPAGADVLSPIENRPRARTSPTPAGIQQLPDSELRISFRRYLDVDRHLSAQLVAELARAHSPARSYADHPPALH